MGTVQEMQYAVGKYCCARLQLYHALMHYKHRLRGKLKKRIKKEHNISQVCLPQLYDTTLCGSLNVL